MPVQSHHHVKNPSQQYKGMAVSEGEVAEEVANDVGEEDSTVINGGSPTLKTFHKLIGSKLNIIHCFFTSAIVRTSPNLTTKRT